MRRTGFSIILSALALGCLLASARGDKLVISFDPEGTIGEAAVEPFTKFYLYFIGRGADQVVGWEMAMEVSPLYNVTERYVGEYFYNDLGSGPDNWLVAFGACRGEPDVEFVFVRYELMYLGGSVVPEDETVCFGPANDGQPPASEFPMYVDCQNEIIELRPGNRNTCDPALNGCAVLNPSESCVVGNQQRSWSALKAAFTD